MSEAELLAILRAVEWQYDCHKPEPYCAFCRVRGAHDAECLLARALGSPERYEPCPNCGKHQARRSTLAGMALIECQNVPVGVLLVRRFDGTLEK